MWSVPRRGVKPVRIFLRATNRTSDRRIRCCANCHKTRNFCQKGPLWEVKCQKGPPTEQNVKNTVAASSPGDTWRLPPRSEAAPCRQTPWRFRCWFPQTLHWRRWLQCADGADSEVWKGTKAIDSVPGICVSGTPPPAPLVSFYTACCLLPGTPSLLCDDAGSTPLLSCSPL